LIRGIAENYPFSICKHMSDSNTKLATKLSQISKQLGEHYDKKFEQFGANSQGVDWGEDERRLRLRYSKMLAIISKMEPELIPEDLPATDRVPSLLDVGCGYGGLLVYATEHKIPLVYTGIDMSAKMIAWANKNLPEKGKFIAGDILNMKSSTQYDYVVCNGILTQKLDTPGVDMDDFAKHLTVTQP